MHVVAVQQTACMLGVTMQVYMYLQLPAFLLRLSMLWYSRSEHMPPTRAVGA